MKILDVNVLIAAHRVEHPHHAAIRGWFDAFDATGEAFSTTETAAVGFVRLVTSRRVVDPPTRPADAFAFLRALIERPTYLPLRSSLSRLDVFGHQVEGYQAFGDLVPDAHLAAAAVAHGATVVSMDRDFARFDNVRWERPPI